MSTLGWIVLFTFAGSVLGVLVASLVLAIPKRYIDRMLPFMVSFAIGSLLGAAFLALLPHALEGRDLAGLHQVTLVVLLGVLGFFLIEKMLIWRHCHLHNCEGHPDDIEKARVAATGRMILVGDGVHNLVDGVLVAAAFLTDFHLGVVTTFAVLSHEIPQELGDVVLLLRSGFGRRRALWFNLLSALPAVAGGVFAYYTLVDAMQAVPFVLAIAASSFIYIAMADLIPALHRRTSALATTEQLVLIAAGILVVAMGHGLAH